ncbi:MAG: hypothetical protein NTY35_01295 [Planctomycetota bacterium]|nr:hypothetical protein [Planctomycetota bacterium]
MKHDSPSGDRLRVKWLFRAGILSIPVLATGAHARIPRAPEGTVRASAGTMHAAAHVSIPTWQVVGTGPASPGGVFCTQILVSPAGVPHLAYQDFTAPSHRLGVRRFAEGAWTPLTTLGSGSAGDAWYNRLALQSDGTLLVATRDYGVAGALSVRRCRRPGAPWEAVSGGPASIGEAHYTDIAVGPDDRIYATFQDRSSAPQDRTAVIESSGGPWRTLTGPGLGGGYCAYQSLALRPDGTLLVGYTDGALAGRASVSAWSESTGAWESLGVPGFTPDVPNNLILRVAPDGTAYVAYYVWNQSIVVRAFNGVGWPTVGPGVDGPDVPTVETEGWRQWLGLEIDAAGRPVVAYQAANLGRRAVVKRWDPLLGAWSLLGEPGFTPGAADYLSLDLAPDGTPYVAFKDGTTGRALVMSLR